MPAIKKTYKMKPLEVILPNNLDQNDLHQLNEILKKYDRFAYNTNGDVVVARDAVSGYLYTLDPYTVEDAISILEISYEELRGK